MLWACKKATQDAHGPHAVAVGRHVCDAIFRQPLELAFGHFAHLIHPFTPCTGNNLRPCLVESSHELGTVKVLVHHPTRCRADRPDLVAEDVASQIRRALFLGIVERDEACMPRIALSKNDARLP